MAGARSSLFLAAAVLGPAPEDGTPLPIVRAPDEHGSGNSILLGA